VIPVNQKPSPPSHSPIPAWQRLGELALHLHPEAGETIHRWLDSIFEPLNLPASFAARVLRSAEDVVGRAVDLKTSPDVAPLRLAVFTPVQCQVQSPCWGFFRIEKIDQAEQSSDPGHVIEFYLYLEENQAIRE
jgi:hypothetical protein